MEGWKQEDDRDLRRDFPWHLIGNNNHPGEQFHKEHEIYEWTRDLIQLRRSNSALKYGTTITLWSDDFVYAYLRIAADDAAFIIINNGYIRMPDAIAIKLNKEIIPQRVINIIKNQLRHWKTGEHLQVQNEHILITVDGKSIEIFVSI
jgi:alpha-amylase